MKVICIFDDRPWWLKLFSRNYEEIHSSVTSSISKSKQPEAIVMPVGFRIGLLEVEL